MSIALPVAHLITIPNGQSMSGLEPPIQGLVPVGLITPAVWTAAALTFLGSRDGASWFDLYDEFGIEVQFASAVIPIAAARRFTLPFKDMLGLSYLRVRSGLGAAPVAQTGARTLTLMLRPIS